MPDVVKLIVIEGPRPGATFEVRPGQAVVVGRSRESAICIDAPGLSRQHFELRWDGQECRLRDLNSRNGVQLNGRLVSETSVRSGDEIAAADTRYRVEVAPARRRVITEQTSAVSAGPQVGAKANPEATLAVPLSVYDHVAPTLTAARPAVAPGSLLAALVETCVRSDAGALYALIDGAQAFELAFTARLMGNRMYTLFSGPLAVDLAHVGPCLMELVKPEAFLEKWVGAIGTHAGVLFQTPEDLPQVYRHLRRIFIATDEEGQEYFFRFYDPRVLRVFLPTCTGAELDEFFGPVKRWIAEDEDGTACRVFSIDSGRLAVVPMRGSASAEPASELRRLTGI